MTVQNVPQFVMREEVDRDSGENAGVDLSGEISRERFGQRHAVLSTTLEERVSVNETGPSVLCWSYLPVRVADMAKGGWMREQLQEQAVYYRNRASMKTHEVTFAHSKGERV